MTSEAWRRFESADRDGSPAGEIRLDPTHPLDVFLAYGEDGDAFVLKGLTSIPTKDTRLSGISLVSRESRDGTFRLELALLDRDFEAMFRAVVDDLAEATRDIREAHNDAGAIRIVHRVERWRKVFDKTREGLLSRKQIIGLFGELNYLESVMIPHFGTDAALSAWRGPSADEQDFALGNLIIEVKSSLSTRDHSIRISSADQLDTSNGEIFLAVTRVAASMPDTDSVSLAGLVERIREILTVDPAAASRFEVGLFAAGFSDHPAYDEERFAVASLVHLSVEEDFPRLTRATIPTGITSVKYSVSMAACEPFIVDFDRILEAVKDV